ncbi:aldo/keto reductase [Granulosicoccus antarcticus]|uniref:Putative oxidoreductase n=1 Tax=Granulosicoccus antarcticus IMCC3135 TaxID=1192854 RepID=A0A2Z2NUC2_9GAMM|nr:aldo/keto reductase [Granulosicoccus antarcticus]ASJ70704.1 putative oxidoreductase [Granulosicoccus antarcticus IMCC3135]
MTDQANKNALQTLGLQNTPLITGLWQVADLERGGQELDCDKAAEELIGYVQAGYPCFDMADHYGSAELIAGRARARLLASNQATDLKLFTKWCPQPHQCTREAVRAGIQERRERLGVETIDLLQLHWWSFDHPGYIDVMDYLMELKQEGWIGQLGLTNFDTDHLSVLLSCGHEIATNQVCLSVLDQRALGDMSELCLSSGVRLLAYGTLAGGFLGDRWLNTSEPTDVPDWSKMKYQRFIHAVGGWQVYQKILQTLATVAKEHDVSISNVATRWVMQQAAVTGTIVGARLTDSQHRQDNKNLLSLELTEDDLARIQSATQRLTPIRGDCGTEYRRPPFLTASGDLSDHLDALPPVFEKQAVAGRKDRWRISSGSEFEPICGYSRAVRDGNRVLVSGTTATHQSDRVIGHDDLRAQTTYILDKISASLASLGATLNDVIRTRIYLTDADDWETVSRVHGRYFDECLPANTLIEVSRLVGEYRVEIEAEALISG